MAKSFTFTPKAPSPLPSSLSPLWCLISPSPPLLARLPEGGDGGGGAESGGGGSGGSPPSQIWSEGEGGGGRTAAADGSRCGEWRGWRFPSLPDLAEGGGGRAAPVSRMEAVMAAARLPPRSGRRGGGERAVVAQRLWRRAAEAGAGAESRGSGAGGSPPSQIWPERGGRWRPGNVGSGGGGGGGRGCRQ